MLHKVVVPCGLLFVVWSFGKSGAIFVSYLSQLFWIAKTLAMFQ